MNRVFKYFSAFVFFFMLTANLVFAQEKDSRRQIDFFMKEYEKFVVKAEKAAEKGDMAALMSLNAEAAKFAEKTSGLTDTSDWNMNDAQKYQALTNRYNDALTKFSNSLNF